MAASQLGLRVEKGFGAYYLRKTTVAVTGLDLPVR
jgi:hypothetical protein